jgi:hypothetical protein
MEGDGRADEEATPSGVTVTVLPFRSSADTVRWFDQGGRSCRPWLSAGNVGLNNVPASEPACVDAAVSEERDLVLAVDGKG